MGDAPPLMFATGGGAQEIGEPTTREGAQDEGAEPATPPPTGAPQGGAEPTARETPGVGVALLVGAVAVLAAATRRR